MKSDFDNDNEQLSKEAHRLYKEDRLLDAAHLLRQINPSSLLTESEIEILKCADEYEKFFLPFLSSNADHNNWISLGKTNIQGYVTDMQYLITREELSTSDFVLDMKIDTLLQDKSMVTPLLALLNESDLYSTWLPSWKLPRVRISESKQMYQTGRCSQVVQMLVDLPWPLSSREFILDGVGVDCVEHNKHPNISIRLQTLKTGDKKGAFVVEAPRKNTIRQEFNAGFLFHRPSEISDFIVKWKESNDTSIDEEESIMISFFYKFENKGTYCPEFLLQFGIRVGIFFGWGRFLKAAEQIRDGKLPQHKQEIQKKKEALYHWVEERVDVLCSVSNHEKNDYNDNDTEIE